MKVTKTALAAAVFLGLSGCNSSSDELDHEHGTDGDELTEAGLWPPVLAGIENIRPAPLSARTAARDSVLNVMRASLMNNREVQAALGNQFREFDASLQSSKGSESSAFLFYNYTDNTTVQIGFLATGDIQIDTQPASAFQPPEHEEEVAQAIALAASTLEESGYSLANLQGTGLLAFPPAHELPDTTTAFYAERVLYVTFGPGNGELPEYRALVNLSTNAVTDAGPIQ